MVLNPATPLACLDYTLDKLDLVLVMSVNPGFGGQKFIPGALDKLRAVRQRIDQSGRDIWLEVDGGVKTENIIARAGADTFVSRIGDLRRARLRGDHQSDAAGACAQLCLIWTGRCSTPRPTLRRRRTRCSPISLARSSSAARGSTHLRTLGGALKRFEHHYALLNGLRSALYPGVREGLAALRSRGVRLACVTNKPARFTQPLLEHFDLARYFDAVVSGDSVARGKPDPEPLLAACRQLGVAISEAVMIGDSANDTCFPPPRRPLSRTDSRRRRVGPRLRWYSRIAAARRTTSRDLNVRRAM